MNQEPLSKIGYVQIETSDGIVVTTSNDVVTVVLKDNKRYPMFKVTLDALIDLGYVEEVKSDKS